MVQSANELKMNYDREADVLYCFLGEPREALSIEKADGVVVRVNPETNELVGFTIIDFFRRFAEHPGEPVSVPLEQTA